MNVYWRPGVRVWWRADGEAQIGTDPPAMVFGLTRQEHEVLDAFARADAQLDCWSIARKFGWRRDQFHAFIGRLPPHALVDCPTLQVTPTTRYWSLMEAAGAAAGGGRATAQIIIDGLDGFGMLLASALAAAGPGALTVVDDRLVRNEDVRPGGFTQAALGRVRQVAAAEQLRGEYPLLRVHGGLGAHIAHHNTHAPAAPPGGNHKAGHRDRGGVYAPGLRAAQEPLPPPESATNRVAAVVAHGALEGRRVGAYIAGGIAHLPVVVRDLDVMIGPLVLPWRGPCLRCVHLTFTDDDARWPVVAAQLAADGPDGIDPVVAHLAAAIAAHQVIAVADERPSLLHGVSLHVDGVHPVPRYRRWQPHPGCGCELQHLAG